MYSPYLPILGSSLLSVVDIINDDLHGTAVGRYLGRDNLRCVRAHTSTSDYLSSSGFFFLIPPNDQAVTALLETHELRRWATPQHHSYEAGCQVPWPVFIHLNDSPQRRQQEAWALRTRFWSFTIFIANYLAGAYRSPPLPLVSPSPTFPNFNPTPSTSTTSSQSVSTPTARARYNEGTKSAVLTTAMCHSEYTIIT